MSSPVIPAASPVVAPPPVPNPSVAPAPSPEVPSVRGPSAAGGVVPDDPFSGRWTPSAAPNFPELQGLTFLGPSQLPRDHLTMNIIIGSSVGGVIFVGARLRVVHPIAYAHIIISTQLFIIFMVVRHLLGKREEKNHAKAVADYEKWLASEDAKTGRTPVGGNINRIADTPSVIVPAYQNTSVYPGNPVTRRSSKPADIEVNIFPIGAGEGARPRSPVRTPVHKG